MLRMNNCIEGNVTILPQVLHSITRRIHLYAPYIPSFLAMREADHFIALIDELREYTKESKSIPFPQVFLVDGNGRLHERQAGLATVVGVKAGVPTIGCAKDYHPIQATNDDLPSYLKTQKGFKVACKDILHDRGDWLEICGSSHKQAFGAVSCLASLCQKL